MKLLGYVCLLALLATSSAKVGECDPSPLGYVCMKELAEWYRVHWTLQGELLHMALQGFEAEWVGFAFAQKKGMMAPADAVIGWVDINGPSVLPYRITTQSVFAEDEDFVVTLSNVSAVQNQEATIVRYTRSTTQGRVRIDVDADYPINYAIGDSDSLRYHRQRDSGTIHLAAEPGDGRTTAFRPEVITGGPDGFGATEPEPATSVASPLSEPAEESPPSVEAAESAVASEEGVTNAEAPASEETEEEEETVKRMLDELN